MGKKPSFREKGLEGLMAALDAAIARIDLQAKSFECREERRALRGIKKPLLSQAPLGTG
jgi:hypothetical protein